MKNKTGYVIQEVGWEYDDEYHHRESGGRAVKIFLDKKKADKLCLEMNIKEMKKNFANVLDNNYGGIGDEDFYASVHDNEYDYRELIEKGTDQEIFNASKDLRVVFFEVKEAEIVTKL